MKYLTFILLLQFMLISYSFAQKSTPIVDELLNKEINLNSFPGQHYTLVNEDGEYFMLRRFSGSGFYDVGTHKYRVEIRHHRITLTERVESTNPKLDSIYQNELIQIDNSGLWTTPQYDDPIVLQINGINAQISSVR